MICHNIVHWYFPCNLSPISLIMSNFFFSHESCLMHPFTKKVSSCKLCILGTGHYLNLFTPRVKPWLMENFYNFLFYGQNTQQSRRTLMWCCLFFKFIQFQKFWKFFSISVLVLSGMKGLMVQLSAHFKLSSFSLESHLTAPSASPGNFNLLSSSSLSLDVSWQAIPVEKQNGKLLGYRILYKKAGSQMEKVKEVGPNTLTYKLVGLEFVEYVVRVLGYNGRGNGPVTNPLRRFPLEGGKSCGHMLRRFFHHMHMYRYHTNWSAE